MKCVNCYREIDDGMKFCPKCGFMQPSDRATYEREHPELATALPGDEILKKVNVMDDKPNSEGYIIPPLPPELPSTPPELYSEIPPELPPPLPSRQPTPPDNVAIPPLEEDLSEIPPLPDSQTSVGSSQPFESQKTVACPICHRPIAIGSRQCNHCHQLLDWSNSTPIADEKPSENTKNNPLLIVLAVIFALLVGGVGYYIYNSLKEKPHISKYDDDYDIDGPTGNPRTDAKRAVNEVIELMNYTYITNEDDVTQLEKELNSIQEKYEDYYRERGELDEFNNEINFLENDPEIKMKVDKAVERLERQISNLGY